MARRKKVQTHSGSWIVVVAIALYAIGRAGSSGPAPAESHGPVGFIGESVPSIRPASTGRAALTPLISSPSETPDRTLEAGPTATPKPTPIALVIDDLWSVGDAKTSESGKAGSYTWTDVEFTDDLGRIAWSVKASRNNGCTVSWSLSATDIDEFGKTLKVGAGSSSSGSKEFESAYDAMEVAVKSTCPAWTLALTSYPMPRYWNPWGYNFKPGSVIYNPPADFCAYFDCIPSFWDSTNGYVMQCADLMFSHSGGRQGSCSYHGGNYRPLYRH